MKKIIKQNLLIVLVILSSFYSKSLNASESNKFNITYYEEHLSERDSIIYYYLDTVSFYLDSFEVEEKPYVLSQALWETGWFQCENCAWSIGENMFGFRGKNGYIKYASWVESVEAYAVWQKKRYTIYKEGHPNGTYTQFLIWAKYATSTTYVTHVKYMYNWLMKNYYD